MNPLITVYILNYNYGKYVTRAIESVINQTYKNFELIIVDDFSTDGSKEIIIDYCKNHQMPNDYKVIAHEVNKGLIKSANSIFKYCKGDYVVRIDADDWIDTTFLEIMADYIKKNPHISRFIPWYGDNIDDFGIFRIKLEDEFTTNGAGCVVKKTDFEEIGFFNEKYDCQDGFYLSLYLKHYLIVPTNYHYFKHGQSLTRNFNRIIKNRRDMKMDYVRTRKKCAALFFIRGNGCYQRIGDTTYFQNNIRKINKTCLFDKIFIVSDRPGINNKKIEWLVRSKDLENESTIEPTLYHFKHYFLNYDYIFLLHWNCPLRKSSHIVEAFNTLIIHGSDYCYSVSRRLQSGQITLNGKNKIFTTRRAVEEYETNGMVYAFDPKIIEKDGLKPNMHSQFQIENECVLQIEDENNFHINLNQFMRKK